MDVLYINNDHVIEIQGLRDGDGKMISGAAATATLYEADGVTEVAGQVWPLALVYTGSKGIYRGGLSRSVAVSDNHRYIMQLSANYVGKQFEVTRIVQAKTRNT